MSMLMNAHPQVASVGELNNSIGALFKSGRINQYYCSCGVEITECKFWLDVREKCKKRGIELNLHDFQTNFNMGFGKTSNRLLFGHAVKYGSIEKTRNNILWMAPGSGHAIKKIIFRNLSVAEAVLDVTGKRIFFDASKDSTAAFYYAKNREKKFRFIHLVRDPRGVLNSFIKRHGDENYKKGIANWMGVHRAGLWLRDQINEHSYMVVRYEDLCLNMDETLKKVSQFLGVVPLNLIDIVNEQSHHIIGNQMRRSLIREIRLDEEWRERLTTSQLNECERVTGQLSKVFGYDGTT